MLIQPDRSVSPEDLGSLQLLQIPLCHQETPYTCGVACVQSILGAYGIIYTQEVLSEMLKQKPIYGTDHRDILAFMERLGFLASFQTNMNIGLIKELIHQGVPPILMLQAWKDNKIDYSHDWSNSHYAIACGYTEDLILFMDPWVLGNYTYLYDNELMKRWHTTDRSGKHYDYSGLIIKHEQLPPSYNPRKFLPMD
jgi:ABC-type bacteriocin/lantibiotic exporter with double-glycine peptidase domain